jgi:hypothetical protein
MSTTAEHIFSMICKSPAQWGRPNQVETALWTCMVMWSEENLPSGKNHTHNAVSMIRKLIPALHDKAGLMFADLCASDLNYDPVVRHMTSAFELLRTHAEGSEIERQTKRFVKMIEGQNLPTCARLRQIFFADLCTECWGKRPDIIAASKGVNCRCWPRPVP